MNAVDHPHGGECLIFGLVQDWVGLGRAGQGWAWVRCNVGHGLGLGSAMIMVVACGVARCCALLAARRGCSARFRTREAGVQGLKRLISDHFRAPPL